jgi:hypothetical protein
MATKHPVMVMVKSPAIPRAKSCNDFLKFLPCFISLFSFPELVYFGSLFA